MSRAHRNDLLGATAALVALASFGSSAYVALAGGYAPLQLFVATLVALSLPLVVVGLAAEQRPGLASIGQAGAIVFALGCLLGAFVVLYALVAEMSGPEELRRHLDGLVWGAQAFLVPGGVAFGAATYVRGELPRWSSGCFVLGMLLVVAVLDAPAGFGLVAEGLRDLGLLGMGLALVPARPFHPRRLAAGA